MAVAAGLVVDRMLGEPPARAHPVALFGRAMTSVEGRLWGNSIARGAVYTAVGVATATGASRLCPNTAPATATVVSGHELRRVASIIGERLEQGDVDGARRLLPALVGRDPVSLDESGIAAAVIESLAENTVDAVVAPVMWASMFGAVGAFAYRAINTMDAMVGHRSDRFERFGKVSAVTDDLANYIPARATALLMALAAPHRSQEISLVVGRDAAAHPSPNAGVAEAAMAAALGRRLGGPLTYAGVLDDRPVLGDGPRPQAADIADAVEMADRVERILLASLLVLAAVWWNS